MQIPGPNRLSRHCTRRSASATWGLLLFLVFCSTLSGRGATRTVTSLAASGPGSLRTNIVLAAPGDTIVFGVTGTILLTNGQINIPKPLTITGPGPANLTIDGGDINRIFQVNTGVVNISGINFRNGGAIDPAEGGGAIRNFATLTLSNCVFASNFSEFESGGAIENWSVLEIQRCTFTNNSAYFAGAIFNRPSYASLDIQTSFFSRNSSGPAGAGAIGNSGQLVLRTSTLANNFSEVGGGIYSFSSATVEIENSTITGNSSFGAGAGIYISGGLLTVSSSTICSNQAGMAGGGIRGGLTNYIFNSIFAFNTGGTNSSDLQGTFISAGYNLIRRTNGLTLVGDSSGNLLLSTPLLGALSNDGGPTPVHPLLLGSAGIDQGTNVVAFDQRGAPRPADGNGNGTATTDIGAYEYQNTPPFLSNIPNSSTNEDRVLRINGTVGDLETPPSLLQFSFTSSNTNLVPVANISRSVLSTNVTYSVVPLTNRNGSSTITVMVSDGQTNTTDTFVATFTAANDPPTISSFSNRTNAEDTAIGPIAFTIGDIDSSLGSLTVSGNSSNPALVPNVNLFFGGSGSNRTLTIQPATNAFGSATIFVRVSDGAAATTNSFNVVIVSVNDSPVISQVENFSIEEDAILGPIAFTVGDLETAAQNLSVFATSSNQGLVPNGNVFFGGSGSNRTVTVIPNLNSNGVTTIRLVVQDANAGTNASQFLVTVLALNDPPILNPIGAKFVNAGQTLAFTATASDIDTPAGSLSFSLDPGGPPGASISLNGSFSWTVPPLARPSTNYVTIRVRDSGVPALSDTETISIVVRAAPVILQNPLGQVVPLGGTISLSVLAEGTEPMTYRWQRNGATLVQGLGLSSLTLTNAQTNQTGSYRVIVTNIVSAGITSAPAAVTVVSPPLIVTQPTNQTIALGGTFTFCVNAVSAPLEYQWRLNGVSIPGATNSCYTINNAQLQHAGSYAVIIANAGGAITSADASLAFNIPIVTPGDHFSNRVAISGSPNTIRGANQLATKEFGEPDHAGKPGGKSIWYKWVAPDRGIATFRTVGSSFDTLLAVYTGASIGALDPVASNEDDGGFLTSEVQFNTTAGVEYQIAIDGFAGAGGDFVLDWSFEKSNQTLPLITTQPGNVTIPQGGNAVFTVTAQGQGLSYEWLFNGNTLTGRTAATLTRTNVQDADVGFYTVRVRNNAGREVLSQNAALEIGTFSATHSVDKFEDYFAPPPGGGGGIFSIESISAAAETASAIIQVRAGDISSHTLSNVQGTTQTNEVLHCGVICRSTRWLVFSNGTDNALLAFNTAGSPIPTVLAVYTQHPLFTLPSTNLVTCAVTNGSDGKAAFAPVFTGRRTNYWVAMDGVSAKSNITLNWAVGHRPTINQQPSPANVVVGESASFTVGVTPGNLLSPSFLWQRGNTGFPASPSPTLLLPGVQISDEGDYYAVVSNAVGKATSSVVHLTVRSTVTISESRFDLDADGWGLVGDPVNVSPQWQNIGGGHGGIVSAQDQHTGIPFYWKAPSKFLGNKSGVYGGFIEYELRASTTVEPFDDADLILQGAETSLIYETPNNPGTDWTPYRVQVVTNSWRVNALDGPPPTLAEMLRVLACLTNVLVRGEFSQQQDGGDLDNFALIAPILNDYPYLLARGISTNLVQLEWPTNSIGFLLENTVLFDNWAPSAATPFTSNGLNNAFFDPSTLEHLRLRKVTVP